MKTISTSPPCAAQGRAQTSRNLPARSLISRVLTLATALSLFASAAQAQDVTLDAVGRGSIRGNGSHFSSYTPIFSSSYSIGNEDDAPPENRQRAFLVFEPPAAPPGQVAVSAKLRLYVPANATSIQGGPSQVDVHDVDVPVSALEDRTAVFDDIGDGPVFGSRIYSDADEGTFTEISLNADGLAALNAALGGEWALSLRHTEEDDSTAQNENNFVFAGSGALFPPVEDGNTQLLIEWGQPSFTTDLIADGGSPATAVDVGDVTVTDLGNGSWEVTYQTTGDWVLLETHFHAACTPGSIPQKKGNPTPGKFGYATSHDNSDEVQMLTFQVTDPGCCDAGAMATYFAAHAVVMDLADCWDTNGDGIDDTCRVETAWGDGLDFPGNNWATYFVVRCN